MTRPKPAGKFNDTAIFGDGKYNSGMAEHRKKGKKE